MWNFDALTGRESLHLVEAPQELDGRTSKNEPLLLHADVVEPLMQLHLSAQKQGIDLRVASSYRSFERQQSIWNRKCRGELLLLNEKGRVIDPHLLTPTELLFAVSRWSALPGASRHHWGTDVDLVDHRPISNGYEAQLVPEEYSTGGAFALLGEWLKEELSSSCCPFARPYEVDRGGVAPEPWHLSYKEGAMEAERSFSIEDLRTILKNEKIELSSVVLEHLSDYWERWIASAFLSNSL